MTQRPAGLVYGFWGQNIGNAFINIGGAHAIQAALGGRHLVFLQDQPAYWTFRNERKGNYPNAFSLIAAADVSPVILQGPALTPNFGPIWRSTFEHLQATNRGWAGVGVGLRKYTSDEKHAVADALRRFPPQFLATRDRETYQFLSGLGLSRPIHDGIDSGFFCAMAYDPPRLRIERPLTCLAFDHFPEPRFRKSSHGEVQIGSDTYKLTYPRVREALGRRGKATGIAAQALPGFRHGRPPFAGSVVRPNHRTNPHLPFVLYREKMGFASDEPYSYLALYASADLTISDRVHACVATLAYGGSAMLHNPTTKRAALFDRIDCGGITSRPAKVARGQIDDELDRLTRFLDACFQVEYC